MCSSASEAHIFIVHSFYFVKAFIFAAHLSKFATRTPKNIISRPDNLTKSEKMQSQNLLSRQAHLYYIGQKKNVIPGIMTFLLGAITMKKTVIERLKNGIFSFYEVLADEESSMVFLDVLKSAS